MAHFLAEEVDQRHQHQPRQHAAGHHHARGLGSDDVTNAQVLRRRISLDGRALHHVMGAKVGLKLRCAGPHAEKILILKKCIQRAQAESEEDAAGKRAALLSGNQHIGAGRALGKLQLAVLLHNQIAAQRHHEQHAQKAADQRQHEDTRVLQVKAQKNQRRQREDHPRGNRLPRVARRLNDHVLQNGAAAKGAQNADRKHRNRNRSGHREPSPQADINGNSAKEQAEERAKKYGADGKFSGALVGRNKRLENGGLNMCHGGPPKS